MKAADELKITLTRDEALVLFEFFARFGDTNELAMCNNAEFLALSKISAQLDKMLDEPFTPDYPVRLRAAQEKLAGDYEGLAPGVKP